MYACGTIRPGDHVRAVAGPGSGLMPGNPGIGNGNGNGSRAGDG